jgi:hypothetical protein
LNSQSGVHEKWSHAQLSPGPKVRALPPGDKFALHIDVLFASQVMVVVEIQATITKPDGTTHATYCRTITGTHGETQSAHLFIST